VQAHPFRQRQYINKVVLSTGCVDAVEVANGGHEDVSNDALACRYAQKIGKPMLAGTDIHDAADVFYGDVFGVYFEEKLNNITDYVNMILNNRIAGIKTDDYRLEFLGNEKIKLPCEIRDKYDNIIDKNWKELIF
jgi:hypothetical protein